eukprot:2399405-Amphidinium_carterae.1
MYKEPSQHRMHKLLGSSTNKIQSLSLREAVAGSGAMSNLASRESVVEAVKLCWDALWGVDEVWRSDHGVVLAA